MNYTKRLRIFNIVNVFVQCIMQPLTGQPLVAATQWKQGNQQMSEGLGLEIAMRTCTAEQWANIDGFITGETAKIKTRASFADLNGICLYILPRQPQFRVQMSGLIMIKSPVFVFAITQHSIISVFAITQHSIISVFAITQHSIISVFAITQHSIISVFAITQHSIIRSHVNIKYSGVYVKIRYRLTH